MKRLVIVAMLLITQLIANSYLDSVINLYKKELNNKPNSVELKDKLAIAYFSNKEYKKAIELYKELLDKTADSKYLEKIAFVYIKQKEPQKAAEYLLKSLEGSKDKYAKAMQYADLLFNLDYSYQAIPFYKKALEIKESKELFLQLAYCYNNTSNYKKAIETLNKAIAKYPNFIDLKDTLAFSYFLDKDRDNTIKILDMIKVYKPKTKDEYYALSYIYEKLNMFKEAEYWTKEIISNFKDNRDGYESLILVYFAQKKYKEGLMLFGELDEDKKDEYAFIYNYRKRDFKNAKEYLEKMISSCIRKLDNSANMMELELVTKNKISQNLKDSIDKLIKNPHDQIKRDMLLLLEEIANGKEIDINYLKNWKKEHINSFSSLAFWNYDVLDWWAENFKDKRVKDRLEMTIKFFKGERVE